MKNTSSVLDSSLYCLVLTNIIHEQSKTEQELMGNNTITKNHFLQLLCNAIGALKLFNDDDDSFLYV